MFGSAQNIHSTKRHDIGLRNWMHGMRPAPEEVMGAAIARRLDAGQYISEF